MSKPSAFVFRDNDGSWRAEADTHPVHPVKEAKTLRECLQIARAKGYAVRRAKDCDSKVTK